MLMKIGEYDRFQILNHLHCLSVDIARETPTQHLRNVLKKTLLEEILKTNQSICYHNKLLEVLQTIEDDKGYRCCKSGCRAIEKRHRDYIKHLRTVHPHLNIVVCNYGKTCPMRFVSIQGLIKHIKSSHCAVPQPSPIAPNIVQVQTSCLCDRVSCGRMRFQNVKELMTHFNIFHSREERQCLFFGCDAKFKASEAEKNSRKDKSSQDVVRQHFTRKHVSCGDMRLKPQYLTHTPLIQTSTQQNLTPMSGKNIFMFIIQSRKFPFKKL